MSADDAAGQPDSSRPEEPSPGPRWRRLTGSTGSPRRTLVNRLIIGVALVSIAWSGYVVWIFWSARHAINEACAGVVPPGKVADLPYSGGRIEGGPDSIDLGEVSGSCVIFSAEAGEATGSDGNRAFFEASVGTEPSGAAETTDHSNASLIDEDSKPYLENPLGGGVPGIVTDSGVGVRLPCDVTHGGEPVKNVVATAVTHMAGYSLFGGNRQMSQDTRDALASIAVETANRIGEKLGCAQRLPAPPSDIPPVKGEFIAPSKADGTCAWYDEARAAASESISHTASDWLPDRVMETPADRDVWKEKCGLAMSGEAADAVWQKYGDMARYPELDEQPPREKGEWWASAQSFFGESARNVQADDIGTDRTHAEPGTAGRSETAIWWASSVCHGEPAVHTLTLGYPYSLGAVDWSEHLFRAYVRDVAERRGCTDITFPPSSEFTFSDG